jgi:hypothetical protein
MAPHDMGLKELRKAIRAIVVVLLHTLVSGVIILCMWATERLILLLWGGQEPVILGVHLHTIMLSAEVTVLLVFLVTAAISAALTFWR